MGLIVRAVDVGSGNTKFVTAVSDGDIRCASYPSIAYPSSDGRSRWPGDDGAKTMFIPVGALYYEVGPDVMLAADTFRASQLHDDYIDSPEYLALLRGALRSMRVSHIDLLVVGLPVALFAVKKSALERSTTGRHDIGHGKVVTVAKVMTVAQPQGALVHYAHVHQRMPEIAKERSLIIDSGSRTFDWLVSQGMRLVQKQSHSVNRGVSDVLKLLAAEITKDIGSPYRDLDAIDLALRTGKAPVIFQKPYDMKRLVPLAQTVAEQAVSSMKEWIEAPHSLQNIVLVGGGAFLFRKAVKAAFPRHRIHELKEPMFANVRGFQLAGLTYARTVLATEAERDGIAVTHGRVA